MTITVRLFAGLREHLGTDSVQVDAREGLTVSELFNEVLPDLADAPLRQSIAFAIGTEYVADNQPVADGDEVVFIPPLGGGTPDPRVHLTELPLDLAPLLQHVAGPGRGGLATFTGNIRNHFEGRPVTHLDYEAYEPMALAEMSKICDEIEERWEGSAVAMSHRLGRLEIGDAAVHIVVAAPHRGACFEACRYGIDELKLRVPIFKKEVYVDGSVWKANRGV